MSILDILFPKQKPIVKESSPIPSAAYANRYITIVHESGHLLGAWFCTAVTKLNHLEVNDNGGIVHCTYFANPSDPKINWTRAVISLCGIAAETHVYKRFRSGPSRNDLQEAADYVKNMRGHILPAPITDIETSLDFSKIYKDQDLTAGDLYTLTNAYKQARKLIRDREEQFYKLISMASSLAAYNNTKVTEKHIEAVLGSRVLIKINGLFNTTFI